MKTAAVNTSQTTRFTTTTKVLTIAQAVMKIKFFQTSHTEMNLYHVTKCEKITYATKLKMIMLLLSF